MTTSWMTTTAIARENDTSTAIITQDNSSWRPLAIALPVCLVGIPLVTVIVIVLITCYRSKFKHKENSIFGRKSNGENRNQSEATEIENGTGVNRTENPASLTSVYANLSETVEEARSKKAMGNNNTSNSSNASNSSNSINGRNGFAKGIHWPPTVLWKKRQVSITENAEAEKGTTTNGTGHKDKRKEKAEREEESRTTDIEARVSGTGLDRTPGETTAETPGTGNPLKVNGLVLGPHGVPMRQKKEATIMKNQNTDNAAATTTTTTTMTVTAKPSQTDTRKTFVVMYPMDSDETNHLPLAVNDVIFFMDEEKDGWLKGEKKESGEVGWFPRTYVREGMSPLVKRHSMHARTDTPSENNDKTTAAATTTSARATMATMMMTTQQSDNDNDNDAFEDFDDDDDDDETEYQALYPYRATEDGDINFDAGDVIVVVEKQDNGWWYGYHGDDHGFFPGSYVQISRTDELSQTLSHVSSQATGDSGPAAGDARHLDDDPEMLLTLAEEDEEEEVDDNDDDDAPDHQKQNKKKKKKLSSARKSLGVFLMSLPHRITSASNRPSGNNDITGQVGLPVVTSDPAATETIKTKKSDRIVVPTAVKKKANKMKIKKTKNDRNLGPMARRSSLAPSPPQSGPPQGAVAHALAKGVMSGLAQMVAAEAAKRHDDDDPMNTTYEEIGTTELFSPTTRTTELNLSDSNEIPFYEIVETSNNRDAMSNGRRGPTSAAAASHGFDAKRNDVGSTEATTYSNLDCAVQSIAAAAKESSNRRGQETKRTTEDNKLQREDKNKEQLDVKQKEQLKLTGRGVALMSTDRNRHSSSRKPVPPLKPSYIGSSTPNIAELLKAIDSRTDGRARQSPGNKPRTLAKPGRNNNPRGGRGSDLGLTGSDLKMVLPQLQKPKPLTEKPRYLSPGFPHGVHQPPKPDQQMQRRDIYRSLDSIMVAAEAESDEDEAAGELEIFKWLRRKQSVEEELMARRGDGESQLNGVGKELQQIQTGKTKDISDGTKQDVVEQVDGARIALMFESLSKAGLNEESFV